MEYYDMVYDQTSHIVNKRINKILYKHTNLLSPFISNVIFSYTLRVKYTRVTAIDNALFLTPIFNILLAIFL